MQKIVALVVALGFFGCSAAGDEDLGQADAQLIGGVGVNPNPLTFWWYGTENPRTVPMLECAIERINAATCLGLDVSIYAHHWVRFVPGETIPGLAGHTGGWWDSMRIRVTLTSDDAFACDVLVHEIGQHVLRRSNSHIGGGANVTLTEPLLTSICERQDCGCFNPE